MYKQECRPKTDSNLGLTLAFLMMFKSPFVFRIVHILLIGIKRFRFPCSVKSKVPIAIWAKLFNANDMLWDIKIVACAFDHV